MGLLDDLIDGVCDIASGVFGIAKDVGGKVNGVLNDASYLSSFFLSCDDDELQGLLSGRIHYKNTEAWYNYRNSFADKPFTEPSSIVVKTAIQKAAQDKGLC